MANELTDIGEEWLVENNIDAETIIFTLYNQATDSLSETSTLGDITTEPGGASYARQSSAVSTLQISGDFGADNDSLVSFDTSDSTQEVDHVAFIVNFQSDTVAGDTTAVDHLVGFTALSSSRNLSDIDTLEFAAGDLELTLT